MKQCLLGMEDLCNHELNTAVAAFVRPSQSTFQHMSGGTLYLAEELQLWLLGREHQVL